MSLATVVHSKPDAAVAIERPQRWDRPFGPDMTDADVQRVLQLDLFAAIDPTLFPAKRSLADTIRNDARLVRLQRGQIIVREGDYGNSVFVVLKGQVRVLLGDVETLDRTPRRAAPRRSFFSALAQLWQNADMPEVRDVAAHQGTSNVSLRDTGGEPRPLVRNLNRFLNEHETVPLGAGQYFGEIAALARTPRTATVFAEDEVELVELRWQGLRDIRRRDARFRQQIDELYRQRSMVAHLSESPLFAHLDKETLDVIASQTLFETYGEQEWYATFKRLKQHGAGEILDVEPIIAEQGHYLDGLMMILSGFARITEQLDYGERTLGYATRRDVFGLEEIVGVWRGERSALLDRSLRAVGCVDILCVPTDLVETHVLPGLPPQLIPASRPGGLMAPAWQGDDRTDLQQSLVDFLVDNRTINGTATMLIDTDRCTGCDDCVRACAVAHDNNPRFVRNGLSHGPIQVATACMHCSDPVCLIGCPTGAIARNLSDGRVLIDDRTCIGCGTCANSCPYNNIRLVEIRDAEGRFILDKETQTPILKATKCDLCYGQLGGPACQRACPHDALIRIDMGDQDSLRAWIGRK